MHAKVKPNAKCQQPENRCVEDSARKANECCSCGPRELLSMTS